jgi:hypothetical protein
MQKVIIAFLIAFLAFITLGYNFFPNNSMIAYADEPLTFSFETDFNLVDDDTSNVNGAIRGYVKEGTGTSQVTINSVDLSMYDDTYVTVYFKVKFDTYYQSNYVGTVDITYSKNYLFHLSSDSRPEIDALNMYYSYGYLRYGYNGFDDGYGYLNMTKTFSLNDIDEIRYNSTYSLGYVSVEFSDGRTIKAVNNEYELGELYVSFGNINFPYTSSLVGYDIIIYGTQIVTPYNYVLQLLPKYHLIDIYFYQNNVLIYTFYSTDSFFNLNIDSGVYDILIVSEDGLFYDLEYTLYLYSDISEYKFLELSVSEFEYFISQTFSLNSAIFSSMNSAFGLMLNDLQIWGIGIGWYIITLALILMLISLLLRRG